MSEKFKQEDHFVAFLDIMGYSDIVLKATEEESFEHLLKLKKGLDDVLLGEIFKNLKEYDSYFIHFKSFKPKIKLFSDNILISIRVPNDTRKRVEHFTLFVNMITRLQLYFLNKLNMLFRGGITKGLFTHLDNFVHGKALIEAYRLEQEADYPRIIIPKNIVCDIILEAEKFEGVPIVLFLKGCIICEGDTYFLNSLLAYSTIHNNNKLDAIDILSKEFDIKDGDDKSLATKKESRDAIINQINIYNNYFNISNEKEQKIRMNIIRRLIWLINYFNFACKTVEASNYLVINFAVEKYIDSDLPIIVLKDKEVK